MHRLKNRGHCVENPSLPRSTAQILGRAVIKRSGMRENQPYRGMVNRTVKMLKI
jgi:hypothetical protein